MKYIARTIGTLMGLMILPVMAAAQVTDPCTFLGSWCGAANVPQNAIPVIANLFIGVAAGTSVMFVIVGGFLMLISLGEEGNVQKGKMAIVYALIGLAITLLAQAIVAFIGERFGTLYLSTDPILDFMTFAVGAMVIIFNSVFVLMMVLAGFRMVFARGNADEFCKSRNMLIWAAIGAMFVNIANALVSTVLNITPLL